MATKVLGRIEQEGRRREAVRLPVSRATGHPGSKSWFTHLTVMPPSSRQASPAHDQKIIPPQFRTGRAPLAPVLPMSPQERWDRYTLGETNRTLTPAQRRRFRRKHGSRVLDVFEGRWRGQQITIVADEITALP